MRRHLAAGAVLTLAFLAPAAANQTTPPSQPRVVLSVPITHPSLARVLGKRVIDIPQAAKDAGHNGSATWTAIVGPGGALMGLVLKDSSNSPAIDAAARAWAEQARYLPATDAAGNRVAGRADVYVSYEPWDSDSAAGGLAAYRCGDLIRDANWFAAANAGRQRIFRLENFYTSMPSLRLMQDGVLQSRAEREASRAKAVKDWRKLLTRCRKEPERVFLDLVNDREFYRGLVGSF